MFQRRFLRSTGSVPRRGRAAREAWEERQEVSGETGTGSSLPSRPGSARWADSLPSFEAGTKLATRKAINKCLTATRERIPGLVAGAGDLTGNTGVDLGTGVEAQSHAHPGGMQVHFGIREHGHGRRDERMALHGGVLPVGGTFFVFSGLCRPSVRLGHSQGPMSSTSSPTTRSAWPRWPRPTSPSSSLRRCGQCRAYV